MMTGLSEIDLIVTDHASYCNREIMLQVEFEELSIFAPRFLIPPTNNIHLTNSTRRISNYIKKRQETACRS